MEVGFGVGFLGRGLRGLGDCLGIRFGYGSELRLAVAEVRVEEQERDDCTQDERECYDGENWIHFVVMCVCVRERRV